MWPTLMEVQTASGPVGMHTYGLFIVLAFSAAFVLVNALAPRIGLHPDRLIAVYISAAIGGLLGGRILYALAVDLDRTIANPLSLFSCAGFAFYGGVLGGALGVALLARYRGIDLWRLGDLAGPAVVLGLGVGRMGCFFAGCCHGAAAPVADNPIGLLPEAFTGGQIWLSGQFPFLTTEVYGGVTRAELLHTPLYPTQMWSAVVGISLAALLTWLWRRRTFDGQIAALALIIEPPFRILIESMRADHRGYVLTMPVSDTVAAWFPGMTGAGSELDGAVMGLTTSQAIGMAMIATGIGIYVLRRSAGREPDIVVDPEDADLDAALFE